MTERRAWITLDQGFMSNPKVVHLSASAIAIYVSGLCYAATHLTDGFLDSRILPLLVTPGLRCRSNLVRDELIKAMLWEQQDDGVMIHDYSEWQRTSQDVDDKRRSERERKAAYRAKTAGESGAQAGGHVSVPAGRDGPSQPVPDLEQMRTEQNSAEPPAGTPLGVVPSFPDHSHGGRQADRALVDPDLRAVVTTAGPTAQNLVAEYIRTQAERPPSRVVGHLGREVKLLLDEGIAPDRVRDGLERWARKGNCGPGALASFVNEAMATRAPLTFVKEDYRAAL